MKPVLHAQIEKLFSLSGQITAMYPEAISVIFSQLFDTIPAEEQPAVSRFLSAFNHFLSGFTAERKLRSGRDKRIRKA
jgi:hypothetical protein